MLHPSASNSEVLVDNENASILSRALDQQGIVVHHIDQPREDMNTVDGPYGQFDVDHTNLGEQHF